MKSIFLVLASAFIIVSGHAQKADPPVTPENVRLGLAQGMVNFVNSVKPFYIKGQDQQKFIIRLCGTSLPTKEGLALLTQAYNYIETNYAADNIIKFYKGNEMAASILYLKKVYDVNPKSDGSEVFGIKSSTTGSISAKAAESGCRWYQIWCHLQNLADWIIANWPVIKDILQTIPLLF